MVIFFKEAYAGHPILNFSGTSYPPHRHHLSPLFCTFLSSHGASNFTTYFLLYFFAHCVTTYFKVYFFTHCLSFPITLFSVVQAPQGQGVCFIHRCILSFQNRAWHTICKYLTMTEKMSYIIIWVFSNVLSTSKYRAPSNLDMVNADLAMWL